MDDDITEFTNEIKRKLYAKFKQRGQVINLSDIAEAARRMVEHKMRKENWFKICTDKDSL